MRLRMKNCKANLIGERNEQLLTSLGRLATQTVSGIPRNLVKGKPRLLWGTEGTGCGEYARPSLARDWLHM